MEDNQTARVYIANQVQHVEKRFDILLQFLTLILWQLVRMYCFCRM